MNLNLIFRALSLAKRPATGLKFLRGMRSTFSQYGEDHFLRIMLFPESHGTFVDVGSHHPIEGSNTFGLYMRGWRGLTIDPNPAFAPLFKRLRPDDTHLVEGVSAAPASMQYFEFEPSVLNTLSAERSEQLKTFGYTPTGTQEVICRPLASMLDDKLHGRHIDFLSVDCESYDLVALQSLDIQRHRPTVILIEDYDRYFAFRDGGSTRTILDGFLRDHDYCPIAQLAFSTYYVPRDWQVLMAQSKSFQISRIYSEVMPRPR